MSEWKSVWRNPNLTPEEIAELDRQTAELREKGLPYRDSQEQADKWRELDEQLEEKMKQYPEYYGPGQTRRKSSSKS